MRASIRRRNGATAIEYGLIAMVVSIAILAGVMVLGDSVSNILDIVRTELSESTGF